MSGDQSRKKSNGETNMKTKTNVRAGGMVNHNQTGIAVRSKVKAGGIALNHDQTTAMRHNLGR
jgi:hypothetical protein